MRSDAPHGDILDKVDPSFPRAGKQEQIETASPFRGRKNTTIAQIACTGSDRQIQEVLTPYPALPCVYPHYEPCCATSPSLVVLAGCGEWHCTRTVLDSSSVLAILTDSYITARQCRVL